MTNGTPLIAFLLPIAHVAVGVGLTYYTLTRLMNRTRIEVSRDELTIRHGPLPWRGNMDAPPAGGSPSSYGVEYGSRNNWGYRGRAPHLRSHGARSLGRTVK